MAYRFERATPEQRAWRCVERNDRGERHSGSSESDMRPRILLAPARVAATEKESPAEAGQPRKAAPEPFGRGADRIAYCWLRLLRLSRLLSEPGRALVAFLVVLGHVPELVLADVGHDDLTLLADVQLLERHHHLLVADAEEAADAQHGVEILRTLLLHEVDDLGDGLAFRILHLGADDVAGGHGGERTFAGHLGLLLRCRSLLLLLGLLLRCRSPVLLLGRLRWP